MPEYRVRPTDPARVARALVRHQVTRPRFWVFLVVVLVGAGLLVSGTGTTGVVVVEAVGVVAVAGSLLYRRRSLETTMAARGYRPGSVVSTDFGGRGFTITTESASARHEYAQIAHSYRVGDVVLLRLGRAKLLLALPIEVVPQPWLDRILRSGARG